MSCVNSRGAEQLFDHAVAYAGEMAVKWLDKPQDHDYPAAADYLGLLADDETIEELVAKMQRSRGIVHKYAKDILRASQLDVLGADNHHVALDLDKIKNGVALSPILLVRGDFLKHTPLVIADGYHRVCASYHTDENTKIPAVLVFHSKSHTQASWG